MTVYCCFFVDNKDLVRDIAPRVSCMNDEEAVRVAEDLLADKVLTEPWRFAAVEIWDDTRKVARRNRVFHSGGANSTATKLDHETKSGADAPGIAVESPPAGSQRATNDFVEALRREHRNIESLLLVLERELAVFDRGDQPDYEIIRAVIEYFKGYPDACHHPREDMVFEKLKVRDAVAVARIGNLEAEHREGAKRLRRVADVVEGVLADQEYLRQTVDGIIRDFVDHQRHHIAMEESLFFPAALSALRTADWADLALQLASQPDPFAQLEFEQKFGTLRRNILKMEGEADATRPARLS